MCVICVSGKGIQQPSEKTILTMFNNNNHGAGYMFARRGRVHIHKGYDNLQDYLQAIKDEKFGPEDVVVYHFRIATQARRYQMTQPFPLTDEEAMLSAWDSVSRFGVAHNGVIYKTSNGDKLYSDTAIYIRDYLAPEIREEADIPPMLDQIEEDTHPSRIAILSGSGRFYLTGKWIYDRGLLFSNESYLDIFSRYGVRG